MRKLNMEWPIILFILLGVIAFTQAIFLGLLFGNLSGYLYATVQVMHGLAWFCIAMMYEERYSQRPS